MSVIRYKWSDGSRFQADPAPIGKAIDKLGKRLGKDFEGLTAEDVVSEASKTSSPLHGLFTWDDAEAASEYRKSQARLVLRSIEIVILSTGKEQTFVGRVAVRTEPGGERTYVPTTLAARQESLRSQMVGDAIAGLTGWKRRYESLAGASTAITLVEQAIESLEQAQS